MRSRDEALQNLMSGPLANAVHATRDWARTVTTSDDFELFLSPQDFEGLDGCRLLGMPIRKSIAVTQGSAVLYDRQRTRYIKQGEQPTETP